MCTVASSSMQTGCVEGRTKTLLMLLCSKATQRSGHIMAWGRSCEEADLASLGWICDAEQLYTDAAPVLDASTRVEGAARSAASTRPHRSALCIRRRPCRWVSGRLNVLMFGVARKLTLRALGGLETPSRRSRRSARARRIYACSSSRKKRPHRSALCTAAVRLSHFSAIGFFVGPKRD